MGQRGPWRSPEPQGALSVSEGLGSHPESGSVRPGGLALRFAPTWGVTRGLTCCWPSTQPLLSQSWPRRHIFPLNLGTVLWLFGRGAGRRVASGPCGSFQDTGVSIQIAVLPILDRLLNPWGMGQPSWWAGSVQGYRVAAGKRGPPCGLPAVLGAGGTAVSSLARLNQQTQG